MHAHRCDPQKPHRRQRGHEKQAAADSQPFAPATPPVRGRGAGGGYLLDRKRMPAMRAADFFATLRFVALKQPTAARAGDFNFDHYGAAESLEVLAFIMAWLGNSQEPVPGVK